MSQQLSLSARPKTLDQLVGQDKLVKRVRGLMASGRIPRGWMLTGPTGCGKTTIGRILALSHQCEHQTVFGSPCVECRKQYRSYDIYEINASKTRGIREIEEELNGADFAPRIGKYRIYILDEFHQATKEAQNLMLKYVEDGAESTVYIICSTEPHKILETLQGRCVSLKVRELEHDDIGVLVSRLLKKAGSDLPADRLADALVEHGVSYPRLIAQAVEKYIAGDDVDDASDVQASTGVDIEVIGRSLVKGAWPDVAKYLNEVPLSDVRAVRLSCISYLRKILLCEPETGDRASAVAAGITELCLLSNMEDTVLAAGLVAALYKVANFFDAYKH